jgi:hypothetical protein
MALQIKFGETTIVTTFDLSPYLTSVSKVIGDVTEGIFMLKEDPTLDDSSAGYTATIGSGITKDGNSFEVLITDYANLDASRRYYVGLGVKFSGDSSFREVPLGSESSTFAFGQDVIRA